MKHKGMVAALAAGALLAANAGPAVAQAAPVSDQDISDAYIYLLSRLLVLEQQQRDFKEGFKWNELVHRKPGQVVWPNPNLDVAYSEAWVAVDEKSCLAVSVPKITDRYYTVHFLNGWGETVANINERVFPDRPGGNFAVCLKGADVKLPATTQRIDVPVKYMRVLARVELGADWNKAVALQHQFKFRPTGKPALPKSIPRTVLFEPTALPGVEAFESAELALDSEADINPGMENLQTNTRAIAKAVKDPAERKRIDEVVRKKGMPDFEAGLPNVGHGTRKDGWALPSTSGAYGNDWLTRTYVNYGGIWANTPQEVIYYKGAADRDNAQLRSDNVYTLTFPKDSLPAKYATYFWSVIAVDSVNRRVLPNPKKRYLLNNQSGLKSAQDGSLTLYFAPEKPKDAPEPNWLPTPKGQNYNLTLRFYRPTGEVAARTYYPPSLNKR
ncbi:DUF1214 domain-containing protein [Variovorax sp. J22R133]|uniref:DUF1214 domain-containing protein n=1 Tax=Variovorax brevis TaxID=3053503 RepID=UPI002575CBEE|nr:DUF1214 domain-containing protein [Variovorax sp. J22R133]MDM0117626.1 DUF1214 domain-containing protein [Variovorax sp. J22R133]